MLEFTGEIDDGPYAYGVETAELGDGMFSVALVSIATRFGGGDFFIRQSDLTISYTPVPEPGTMVLLGAGLIGLAGLGRKKFAKK